MRYLENRVPPPIVFALVAAAMWTISLRIPSSDVFGALRWLLVATFLLCALIGPVAIAGFLRAKTTIDPVRIDRASTLVTTGAFGLTRNPMYLSMACLLIALALVLSVPWLLLGPLLFVVFITRFQIIPEERVMAAKFGEAYAAYRTRVRRWI